MNRVKKFEEGCQEHYCLNRLMILKDYDKVLEGAKQETDGLKCFCTVCHLIRMSAYEAVANHVKNK